MDIGGHDLFTVSSAKDAELRRPTPLQILPSTDGSGYRLYSGRNYIKFSQASLSGMGQMSIFTHDYNRCLRCDFSGHVRCCCTAPWQPCSHWRKRKLLQRQMQPQRPQQAKDLKSAEDAFRAGSAAYLQNDLHSAHIQFAKLVQLAPEVAAGHSAFGTVLLAEGDVSSAIAQLELAHRLDPQDTGAILNLALAYAQSHDYAKSVQMFQLLDEQEELTSSQTLTPQASIAYAIALSATAEPEAAQKTARSGSSRLAR